MFSFFLNTCRRKSQANTTANFPQNHNNNQLKKSVSTGVQTDLTVNSATILNDEKKEDYAKRIALMTTEELALRYAAQIKKHCDKHGIDIEMFNDPEKAASHFAKLKADTIKYKRWIAILDEAEAVKISHNAAISIHCATPGSGGGDVTHMLNVIDHLTMLRNPKKAESYYSTLEAAVTRTTPTESTQNSSPRLSS